MTSILGNDLYLDYHRHERPNFRSGPPGHHGVTIVCWTSFNGWLGLDLWGRVSTRLRTTNRTVRFVRNAVKRSGEQS